MRDHSSAVGPSLCVENIAAVPTQPQKAEVVAHFHLRNSDLTFRETWIPLQNSKAVLLTLKRFSTGGKCNPRIQQRWQNMHGLILYHNPRGSAFFKNSCKHQLKKCYLNCCSLSFQTVSVPMTSAG